MTQMMPLLPDSAPFTPAQRAWLNGFFAAMFGPQPDQMALILPNGGTPATEEDFPWHDSTLDLDARMQLASGKPLKRRMMAAMAQLDCGQCGYLCRTYAEALDTGAEVKMNLCQPGGRETARKLKELLADRVATAPALPGNVLKPAFVKAQFQYARSLNAHGAEKDTRHVVIGLAGTHLKYQVGDSLGIRAGNCSDLAQSVLAALELSPDRDIPLGPQGKVPALQALTELLEITRVSDAALEYLSRTVQPPEALAFLQALLAGSEGADHDMVDLLDVLERIDVTSVDPVELLARLDPLRHRLYSIASSQKAHPEEVHLTLGVVKDLVRTRLRKGVASTFLAERLQPGAAVSVFVQPAHGFALPSDPGVPIIMIGPGTGIAPFRAFLQERAACAACGENWLFFGNQRRAADFLYAEELDTWQKSGLLTRLELAFSRDQANKVYVQDRLRDCGAEIWDWLQRGAHIYVCGDAKRMARDVDQALQDVIAGHGGMELSAAKAWLQTLTRQQRYQRDVY